MLLLIGVLMAGLGGCQEASGGPGRPEETVVTLDLSPPPAPPGYTLESFLAKVAPNTEFPQLLIFYTPGCPHCVRFKPVFREMQGSLLEKAGVVIGEVDFSQSTGLWRLLKVNAYPTLLLFA